MEPEFGSDLYTLVFESVGDEAIALGIYEIRRAIQAWEPRVRLGNIVGKIVGENQVDFEIEYSVQGLSTSQTETFYRSAA